MHRYRTAFVAFAVLACVTACTTRTPETPTGTRGTFEPPTSPAIVLSNLRYAVTERNTENFMLCLADRTTRSNYDYRFEPSAEVRARYQSLFDAWSLNSERQAFLSLIARLPPEGRPALEFTDANIAFSSPDSTIYVTDYVMTANHGVASVPTTLRGTMSLTITPERSGQWSVSTWRDARRQSDTVEATWSLLKAALSN
ncbi:MAG: hypothetical protein FGM24_06105 [Candidatus Kapabacteria bacterium]|nr:hypothetical protein [Candidatus Kapabacteria bacterium]